MTNNDNYQRNNRFGRNNRNNRNGRGNRRFNDRNSKFGNRKFDQRNNQPKLEEQTAPIEYIPRKEEEGKETKDEGSFTFMIPLANNEKLKRKVRIFRSGQDERFLETIANLRNIIVDYPLTTDAANIANTVSQMKECFAGPARADFTRVMRNNPTEDELGEDFWEFTEEILPENAAEEQATYLRTTKKPMKLTAKEWIKQMQVINDHIGLMDEDANPLDEDELVKQVIKPNVPKAVRTKFEIKYRSTMTLKEVSRILGLLLKDANERQKSSNNNDSRRNKFGGRNNSRNNNNNGSYRNNNRDNNDRNNNNRSGSRNEENHRTSRTQARSNNGSRGRSTSTAASNRTRGSEEGYNIEKVRFAVSPKQESKRTEEKESETMGAEIILTLPGKTGKKQLLRGLLDSGTSASLMNHSKVGAQCKKTDKSVVNWNTKGGNFDTFAQGMIDHLQFPQFTTKRSFNHTFHLFKGAKTDKYDVIIGRDLMQALGIDILNSRHTFKWDDIEIPMMPMGYWKQSRINNFMSRMDNKTTKEPRKEESHEVEKQYNKQDYEKPDLAAEVSKMEHLNDQQKQELLEVLTDNEEAFQGTKGNWKGEPIEIQLKKGTQPYFARPYTVPQIYEKAMYAEVNQLIKIGVLKPVENSEWAAPSFGVPKKDGSMRFVSDFRVLNSSIVRKPHPLPRIQDILQSIGEFQFATSLDMSMGYWGMGLSERSKKLCTIVLP